MTTTTTTSDVIEYVIDCPLFCGAESVLTMVDYDHPAVVHPCPGCTAQGGTAWEVTVGQAEHYMRPTVTTTVRHADGLVAFR